MKFFTPVVTLLFFIVLSGVENFTFAQQSNLYIPNEIRHAYQNDTRSENGLPGVNYWQNSSDYRMNVELIPDSSLIAGNAKIIYHNNSPDSLKEIVFRLYQDIYKKGNARQFPITTEDLTDGMDIRYLIIDGDSIRLKGKNKTVRRTPTNLVVKLENPLPPGGKLVAETGWNFPVPRKRRVRMGQYSDSDFFIAYWYPQVAVYDDIDGWDRHEYLGMVEFYNDFCNFDVSVTVPGDYLVWATGELQNADTLLQKKIFQRYRKAMKSDKVIRIVTHEDYRKNGVLRKHHRHTWHFKANHVPDFTFAASNHCSWDGTSLVVDEKTGRRVSTETVYPDTARHYHEAAEFAKITVDYLSKELPGVPYPYPHITVFCNGNRGGGMESPMMVNEGAPKERHRLIGLIFHEIAHSYFPFYMGTNERKYAWMDEGWATFLPREVLDRMAPKSDYWKRQVGAYVHFAGAEFEMPMMIPSFLLDYRPSLRTASYGRPAMAYSLLEDILGRETFKAALQEYVRRWHGKHPIPLDFFRTFEDVSQQNLGWFWKPWFYRLGYPDLEIRNVRQKKDQLIVTVKRVGNLPVPVKIKAVFEDSTTATVYKSTAVWQWGDRQVDVFIPTRKPVQKIILGDDHIPDIDLENNEFVLKPKE